MLEKVYYYLKTKKVKDDEEKLKIERLSKFKFNRSHIKPLVMTKPYNASTRTLVDYLKDNLILKGYGMLSDFTTTTTNIKKSDLELIDNSIEQDTDFIPQDKDKKVDYKISLYCINKDSQDVVTILDLNYFVSAFNTVLYTSYPRVKVLSKYLSEISDLFSKLNLPLI
jgi:hypothetical protein